MYFIVLFFLSFFLFLKAPYGGCLCPPGQQFRTSKKKGLLGPRSPVSSSQSAGLCPRDCPWSGHATAGQQATIVVPCGLAAPCLAGCHSLRLNITLCT